MQHLYLAHTVAGMEAAQFLARLHIPCAHSSVKRPGYQGSLVRKETAAGHLIDGQETHMYYQLANQCLVISTLFQKANEHTDLVEFFNCGMHSLFSSDVISLYNQCF